MTPSRAQFSSAFMLSGFSLETMLDLIRRATLPIEARAPGKRFWARRRFREGSRRSMPPMSPVIHGSWRRTKKKRSRVSEACATI
jgi:hypothetical protein